MLAKIREPCASRIGVSANRVTALTGFSMEVSQMKKCSEVMTKNPFCCLPDATLAEVSQTMKNKGIGSVLVVENAGPSKLVGIVTDRDIVLKAVASGLDPQTTHVKDVMSRKIVTVRTDDDSRKALDAMSKHQLRRIPVVDKDGRIEGIIAQADVATRINDAGKTAAVVKQISQYSSSSR